MAEKQVPKRYSVKDTSREPTVEVWKGMAMTEYEAIQVAASMAKCPSENLAAEEIEFEQSDQWPTPEEQAAFARAQIENRNRVRKSRKDKGEHHVKQVSKAPPKRVRSKAGFSLTIGAVLWYPDKAKLNEALDSFSEDNLAKATIVPGKPLKPRCHKGYSFDEI